MIKTLFIAGLNVRTDFHYQIMQDRSIPFVDSGVSNENCITIPFQEDEIFALKSVHSHLSLGQCEAIHTARLFFTKCICLNRLLLHASAVVTDKSAYLLTASGGCGKTTQAELWKHTIPNSFILSDDKPVVYFTENGAFVQSSPWSKYTCCANDFYKLNGIAVITKSCENRITEIQHDDRTTAILSQYPLRKHNNEKIFTSVTELLEKNNISVWQAFCEMTSQSSEMMYNKMKQTNTNVLV